ncbi:MAG: hypothetical protein KIT31_37995 [Deltaproteobacteria bacterium]|nr:hypothetical protein [Deltaproteobacteria bacterium]
MRASQILGASLASASLALLVACGAPPRPGGGGDDDDGPDAAVTGNEDNCSDAAKLIYVVDSNNTLSKFDPVQKAFNDLGRLSCPASFGATPFSMGIDRNATAWVLYSSGELFQVDTTSLACQKSPWSAQNGLAQFGMGFSTNAAGGTEDTLFVAGGAIGPVSATSKLARLDINSFTAQTVGTIQGNPELTGTGSAELWGFFPDRSGSKVAQLDKATGNAVRTFPLNQLAGDPTAWAFAFHGGSFYIFLAKDLETFTTVYQLDAATGQIMDSRPTNNRTIVGAGVSTCAPVVIGKPQH